MIYGHLKRIEIQGYKSFATKSVFDIDPGITAVVGPNGAGKSNITDALRWVIGEPAGRGMRVRKLEEVIFAGSEQRTSSGFAEVAVTLDNESHWLPLDFSEVTVSRRTHRNGDSEYLINGARVRRRDVVDLFAAGGLGGASYAFMGQGLVEEVLRLRPDERRALIEEVADVRRHRLKLEDAQRRRAETQENLERAHLLVGEVEPRLRTLERQAKRALQHAELRARLQEALRLWYGREWRRLQEEQAARRDTEARERTQRAQSTATLERAEGELAQWERDQRSARAALERANDQQRRLAEQMRGLEEEQRVAGERERLLGDRLAEQRREVVELERDRDQLAAAHIDGDRAGALEQSVAEARVAWETAESELAAIDADLERQRRAAIAAEDRRVQLRREQAEGARRLDEIRGERSRIKRDAAARDERLQELRDRIERTERAASQAAGDAANAGHDAAQARERREAASRRSYAAAAYLRHLEAGRAERERKLAHARDRLALLKQLQAESEGMHAGLRALFGGRGVPREGGAGGVPGVVAVLRHCLRARRGLERAIEAALEDYLEAVIFTSADEAVAVLAALAEDGSGRIVALPLDSIRSRSPLALQPEQGVIGVAAALVDCDRRYRELVDTLLGRTIVVEDMDSARRLARRGLGSVVTRDGRLLRPLGDMVGGGGAAGGPFQREGELRALPEEITALEAELAEGERVEERRAELQRLEAELAAAERDAEAAAAARARAQEEAGQRRAEVVPLQGERERREHEAAGAQARLAELGEEESALRRQQEEHERESAAAARERPQAAVLEETTARRDEQARRVGQAAARLHALEGEHEALRSAFAMRELAMTRAREQLSARSAQVESGEQVLASLTQAIASRASEVDQVRARRDAVAGAGWPEAAEVARLQGVEPARRTAVQAAQRALLERERASLGAEAALKAAGDACEELTARMAADTLRADADGLIRPLRESPDAPSAAEEERLPEPDAALAALTRDDLRARVDELRGRLRWLGAVNEEAAQEYHAMRERHERLTEQITDLEGAERRLHDADVQLRALMGERFGRAFEAVDTHFRRHFQTMFQGGAAHLTLSADEEPDRQGVEIAAQPPGKRLQGLTLLSGGERALTAIALLFAMLEVSPAPFCVLDEVDAALDEANVARFVAALQELAQRTQFIVITHNRRTIEKADSIYGITMGADSASRVLSVRLADLRLEG